MDPEEEKGSDLEEGLDQELENVLNHPAPAYNEFEYWNNRYRSRKGETFEWLQPWPAIHAKIEQYIVSKPSALVIGCGNSRMSSQVLKHVAKVTSIDVSDIVIAQMRDKYAYEPRLEWQTMNCTKLAFANNSFDYVFDKGTIDTLMSSDSWEKLVDATMREVARVLRPGGRFIVVSYGVPNTREKFFERGNGLTLEDTVEIEKPGIQTTHYVYIVKQND